MINGSSEGKENQIKEAKEKLSDINFSNILEDLKEQREGEYVVLFVSFDLVNSSRYKTRNYLNWFDVIIAITTRIKDLMIDRIERCELWRTIGDEVIFTLNIYDITELENSIQTSYIILNEIIDQIKSGTIFEGVDNEDIEQLIEHNILSVKATAWIALVSKTIRSSNKNRKISNIMYPYFSSYGVQAFEFQGNDIDTGFRVSKHTRDRRLVLSVELAYLISRNKSINPKLHIICYENLKGIWDNSLYPIIWYHDEYVAKCKLDDSFFYDEDESDELIHKYKERLKKIKFRDKGYNSVNDELRKVLEDKNMLFKINRIEKRLEEIKESTLNGSRFKKLMESNTRLEIHCVAVCYNEENKKVLMFKRSSEAERYKNKWEFGCAKMSNGLSFSECLEKDYEKFANVKIEVENPFKEYNFYDEDTGGLVSGIRFKARVIDDNSIKLNSKYSEYKYIGFEEFTNILEDQREEYIEYDQFLDVFKYIYGKGGI